MGQPQWDWWTSVLVTTLAPALISGHATFDSTGLLARDLSNPGRNNRADEIAKWALCWMRATMDLPVSECGVERVVLWHHNTRGRPLSHVLLSVRHPSRRQP